MGFLFLHKLRPTDSNAHEIMKAGALSIRRTHKSYARSAVDICLKQTVNGDAATPMRGISAFRNSESAFRRWYVTLTQRGMPLSELREMVGLQSGEEPANQLRKLRIRRDNADMNALANALNNTCNSFATDSHAVLIDVSAGKTTKEETKTLWISDTRDNTSTDIRGRVCRRWFKLSEDSGEDQAVELRCRERKGAEDHGA